MIIRHSNKLLEQLSEIEGLIQKVERLMEENGVEVDREKMLLTLLKGQEARSAARPNKRKD